MSQATTTDIAEGDTLVIEDRWYRITSLDEECATVKAQQRFESGEYPRKQLEDAANAPETRVIRDSDLTAIKGIGTVRAPQVEAETGISDPRELCVRYLTDMGETIEDAVPNVNYLHEYIRDSDITDADLGVDTEGTFVRNVMLFVRTEPIGSHCIRADAQSNIQYRHHGGVKKLNVEPQHIDFESDRTIMNSSSTVAISKGKCEYTHESVSHVPDSVTRDGDNVVFGCDGTETFVSKDLLEIVEAVFGYDPTDVCNAEHVRVSTETGYFSVEFHEPSGETTITVAPRHK